MLLFAAVASVFTEVLLGLARALDTGERREGEHQFRKESAARRLLTKLAG